VTRAEIIDALTFFVPPLVGALWGARYAEDQTPRERLTTWATAVVMGTIAGGASGEYLGFGPWLMAVVMFSVAAVGNEVFAYIVAAFRQGIKDPASAAGKWMDAILGRRPQ
jgi:phage shock protein PspC (stress-responsive transcriptional regulator)